MWFSCICPFLSVRLPAFELIDRIPFSEQIRSARKLWGFQQWFPCLSGECYYCLRLSHLKNAGRSFSRMNCLSSHAFRHGFRTSTPAPETGKPFGLFDWVWCPTKCIIRLPVFWSNLLSLTWWNKFTKPTKPMQVFCGLSISRLSTWVVNNLLIVWKGWLTLLAMTKIGFGRKLLTKSPQKTAR